MSEDPKLLSDAELDKLLAHAGEPKVPADFTQRLKRRLGEEAPSNVIAFPGRQAAAKPQRRWPMAAALAASLVLGLWLGASGQNLNVLNVSNDTVADISGDDALPGFDDLVGAADEGQS